MTLFHIITLLIFIGLGASGLSAIQSAIGSCFRRAGKNQPARNGLSLNGHRNGTSFNQRTI